MGDKAERRLLFTARRRGQPAVDDAVFIDVDIFKTKSLQFFHELMRQICEQMAEKYGVEYLHRDFSPRFREGQDKARELGLYMQNYCGCVFSEEDRYRKRKKKKKPDDAQA